MMVSGNKHWYERFTSDQVELWIGEQSLLISTFPVAAIVVACPQYKEAAAGQVILGPTLSSTLMLAQQKLPFNTLISQALNAVPMWEVFTMFPGT